MGTVLLWGAIAAFILAFVMLVLVGLGFRHARLTPPDAELLAPKVA
jgi:hypothetical protein